MRTQQNNKTTRLGPLHLKGKRELTLCFVLLLCLSPLLAVAEDWIYTTRPGDTLWDISRKHLKSVNYWSLLQQHNSINTAKTMAPGTRLSIPIPWLKQTPAPAIILNISGDVSYASAKDGKVTTLSVDKKTLSTGDRIITGQDGSATIKFADGSTLLLQKQSELILDTLSAFGSTGMVDTRMRLRKGRLETSVTPKTTPGSRYEITTPAAVAAVRGTQFRIGYQADDSIMLSEVVKGEIGVNAAGIDQAVPKGYGTIAEEGSPPLPPKALLAAPDLSQITKKILHLPYVIAWPEIESASAYRVQISTKQTIPTLMADQLTTLPQYSLDQLPSGKYQLVIRGIDDINLEGFNAQHNLELSTDFPIVKLQTPTNVAPLYNGNVSFKWQKPANVARYHLQVAPDKKFKSTTIDKVVDGTGFESPDTLASGQYAWRVAGIDRDGNEGAFSTPTVFTIKDLPKAPDVDVDIDGSNTKQANFSLQWPAVNGANQYVIQVAKDADFKDLIVNKTTDKNAYTATNPMPYGTYYYRAKSIVAKNIHSEYSATKQFVIEQHNSLVFWLWLLLLPLML